MADTQPGRDANGNVDPNHWAGKHVATSGRQADRSQGKDVQQDSGKGGRHQK